MFTGIIEELGTIRAMDRRTDSIVLTIEAHTVLEGTRIGDSIAVNGVCLTVTSLTDTSFTADVMHETMRRSFVQDHRSIWNGQCRSAVVWAGTSSVAILTVRVMYRV